MASPSAQARVPSPAISTKPTDVSTRFWSTSRGAIIRSIIVAVLVFLVSSAADLFMFYKHEPARIAIEISDGISSVLIGLLSYQLLRLQQQRREQLRQRLEMIADMNHHVRNALQVISLSTHGHDQQEIAAVHE